LPRRCPQLQRFRWPGRVRRDANGGGGGGGVDVARVLATKMQEHTFHSTEGYIYINIHARRM
jgi:hypothetical protein